jgi:hypothetical protein
VVIVGMAVFAKFGGNILETRLVNLQWIILFSIYLKNRVDQCDQCDQPLFYMGFCGHTKFEKSRVGVTSVTRGQCNYPTITVFCPAYYFNHRQTF